MTTPDAPSPSNVEPLPQGGPKAQAPTDGAPKVRKPMAAHTLARVVLGVNGAIWLVIGLWALADPAGLLDIIDLRAESPLGRLEIRAMYGGFGVVMGLLHGIAASRVVWLTQGVFVSASLTAGLLAGRLLSVAVEGVPGPTGLMLIGLESSDVAVSFVALWRLFVAARAQKKAAASASATVSG
ncbi:MAG: DUF4345 domain-containing protein [Myxococcales bacterium]|nr:DUF4345 domain-containing protein [Myxococcales bacterium]